MDVLDAQRYAKLRTMANAAKHMDRSIEMDLTDLDREVDSIDLNQLPQIETFHNFAEFATLILNDAYGGFEDAYRMGGTGIYRDGFYWRCLRTVSGAEKRGVVQLMDWALSLPDYAIIGTLVGPVRVEKEHEEDSSVHLPFNETGAKKLDLLRGPMASLMFGDLAIMK